MNSRFIAGGKGEAKISEIEVEYDFFPSVQDNGKVNKAAVRL